MSISFRVLGAAGRDNALLVEVDSGQALERLLFDCGERCLADVPPGEVLGIDQLFFSHFHMDHIGGFDAFFRANYDRENAPNHIWGPPGSIDVLQHRFQGYVWNLHEGMSATWRVSEVHPREIRTARFELSEAFALRHREGTREYDRVIWEGAGCTVEAVAMDHKTPSLAYVVREKARRNIDTSKLAALGLRPGVWLKLLKDGAETVVIDGVERAAAQLRAQLIVESEGEALAFLTDFLLDDAAMERLVPVIRGCQVMVCEGQYRHADLELAQKHHHMTTVLAATLAKRAEVGELVLEHLSDRYERAEWLQMLREAREVFPKTRFPEGWAIGNDE